MQDRAGGEPEPAGWMRLKQHTSAALRLARDLLREWREDRVAGLAAEIAFFGVLSLFPAMLALAAALGSLEWIVGHDAATRAEDAVIDFLRRVLTQDASGTVDAVQRLFEDSSPGLLTVGTLVAVWAASRGFVAVINALDVAYDINESRSYLRLRGLALLLATGTLLVVAAMLAALVIGPLFGSGQAVADRVGLGSAFATFWDWARWPVALVVMILWATTIFHVAPNHRTSWRWDIPGALLTAVSWLVVSIGFRVYLLIAAGGNQVLGTLGGALIVLTWLYLLAVGLLLGGELNAVLVHRYAVPQRPRTSPPALRRYLDRGRLSQ